MEKCDIHVLRQHLLSLGQQMLELSCENATVGTNGLARNGF